MKAKLSVADRAHALGADRSPLQGARRVRRLVTHRRQWEEDSALRLAQRRAVDADRVALVAQPAEQRVDERLVAEEVVPTRRSRGWW